MAISGSIPAFSHLRRAVHRSTGPRSRFDCHSCSAGVLCTSGCPHAAMPNKVANNSPDNRTLAAAPRSRISLTCEGNGGKARMVGTKKTLFHGWLLLNLQLFKRTSVQSSPHAKIRLPRASASQSKLAMRKEHDGRLDGWTVGVKLAANSRLKACWVARIKMTM
jgi:hypothetical protein